MLLLSSGSCFLPSAIEKHNDSAFLCMDVKLGLSHEEIWNEDFWEKVMRMEWIYLEVLTNRRRKLHNGQFHDL